jgi:hypothetical protein
VQPGNPIVGGITLRRPAIQSPNYLAGAAGWTINIDGSAEFNSVTIRGQLDLGSTAPRVSIGPAIPSVLSGWNVNVIFNEVFLWYFNSTDFYWQAIGTFFGTKCYMEGTYDTVNGPYMLTRVLQPSGAGSIESRLGSYLLNTFASVLKTQQQTVMIGDGSNINDTLLINAVCVSNSIAFNSDGNGTAETWHGLAYSNSWANAGGTTVHGSYRLVASPANSLQLVGGLTPGTKTDATKVATLPTGYRPTTNMDIGVNVDVTVAAGGQSPHFNIIASTGAVNCYGCGSAGFVSFNATIPLDI